MKQVVRERECIHRDEGVEGEFYNGAFYVQALQRLPVNDALQFAGKVSSFFWSDAPHILVCRCERPLDKDLRHKISMFCNVPVKAVIECADVANSIYELPLALKKEGMDQLVLDLFGLKNPPPEKNIWDQIVHRILSRHTLKDFLFRSGLKMDEDAALQQNPKFWEMIEAAKSVQA